MNQHIIDILKRHNLRKTQVRETILMKFLDAEAALSHSELEHELDGAFDRVTIYRTLKSFDDKGLIHKVIDDEAVVKYAICDAACDEHTHFDNHVHFKCKKCKQTTCLYHLNIDTVGLPKGYKAEDYQLLIQGLCENCNKEH